jgi:serine acetyltransferase
MAGRIRETLSYIKEDFQVFKMMNNYKNTWLNFFYLPSFRIVLIFRLSQIFFFTKILKPIAYLLTIFNDTVHGVWIGPNVKVGKGFFLGHPRGLVVNPNVIIGNYCSIIQQVTLGGPYTKIGNFVSINAGAKIISDPMKQELVEIGDNCIIAAGAVVLKSMPPNSIIGGMPAKVLKTLNDGDNWITKRRQINSKNKIH